jgi:transcriptional regulator with XRE-family HTH domain
MPGNMRHVNIHVKHIYSRGGLAAANRLRHTENMNITAIRRLRGLTQVDLADMTQISQATISRAENGDDGTTLGCYRNIASALGVPLADLFIEDRRQSEQDLLETFRKLTPERQTGWLEMARAITSPRTEPTE